MLTLKIFAKDYNELHKKLIQIGSELFEFNEEGYFDEGGDEWVHRGESYELDYEEGEPAIAKPEENKKPELKRNNNGKRRHGTGKRNNKRSSR